MAEPLAYEDFAKLPLNQAIVKETLRLNAPIHSIMRKVKQPLVADGTNYVIPTSHTLMSSPGFSAPLDSHFVNPQVWDPHRWDAEQTSFEEPEANAEDTIDYGWGVISKGTSAD